MTALRRNLAVMLSLPIVVFLAGRSIMARMSDAEYVDRKLRRLPAPEDRKPLNQRIEGYDAQAVARHWGALDRRALQDERRALEVDLVFPLLYGASFLASLLIGWHALGRPYRLRWIMPPVALVIASDWTENTTQLAQLQRFTEGRELQPAFIRIASTATMAKLVTFTALMLYVATLAVTLAASQSRRSRQES